jgi:hypothetical protein
MSIPCPRPSQDDFLAARTLRLLQTFWDHRDHHPDVLFDLVLEIVAQHYLADAPGEDN